MNILFYTLAYLAISFVVSTFVGRLIHTMASDGDRQ